MQQATAEADKMQSEAATMKQKADNALIAVRAEANKAKAKLDALYAENQQRLALLGCERGYSTLDECIAALQRATANGKWQYP